jgi:ubiquinone/menaquinone biosynthesis C-methylase UbiE
MNPVNTNTWNRIRYSVWEPIYDVVASPFHRDRARSIAQLGIVHTDRVLLVGAGTGLDLELITAAGEVLATDLTPAMVRRLEQRLRHSGLPGEARRMDAQAMDLPDASFEKVVLNLILAVVPDPVKVIREAQRVLKPGGRMVVFDKFVPPGAPITIGRRTLNAITAPLFSTIDRRFEEILAATGLTVEHDEKASIGLDYRIIVLRKG